MVKPLYIIVKEELYRTPVLVIRGQRYISIPDAANVVGVSRVTMYRWITKGKRPKAPVPEGVPIAWRDNYSEHYYVNEQYVNALRNQRFIEV